PLRLVALLPASGSAAAAAPAAGPPEIEVVSQPSPPTGLFARLRKPGATVTSGRKLPTRRIPHPFTIDSPVSATICWQRTIGRCKPGLLPRTPSRPLADAASFGRGWYEQGARAPRG